ncbi:MAG: aminotransferase class I/II-fold pyridoxal phosphate-dependent enzyme [Pseudomonadota bacterium]
MYIEPFGVEMWMNRYETKCRFNLAETCVASLTLDELLALAGVDDPLGPLRGRALTYGDITGSPKLRDLIAGLFAHQTAQNVLTTHGTIGANALVYQALVSAGDVVASVVPTYQQHVSIPQSIGAQLRQVPLRAEDHYQLDIDALAQAAKGARLISVVNPNNPTGAVLDLDQMQQVVAIAANNDAYLLADEVYRGTHQTEDTSPSFADLYPKALSTGSMSKAFALAGLRLGWIVGPPDVLEAAERHRDYTTISVGMIDDHFATLALGVADKILDRSRRIVRTNHAIVSDWIATQNAVTWVPPKGGTTALVHFANGGSSYALAESLLAETGVLVTPGSAIGAEGTLRLGYANHPDVLLAGLGPLGDFLARQ